MSFRENAVFQETFGQFMCLSPLRSHIVNATWHSLMTAGNILLESLSFEKMLQVSRSANPVLCVVLSDLIKNTTMIQLLTEQGARPDYHEN